MENKAVDEYINDFEVYLKQLDKTERADVTEFYREYIIDANLTNIDEIINELGTPKHLARKVLADYSIKMSEDNYQHVESGSVTDNEKMKKNVSMIVLIILAVLASPVLIPVGIVLIGIAVMFVLLAIFFGLLFVFLVALSVVVAIAMIVAGIAVVFQSFTTTILYVGIGLAVLGLDFILIPLIISFFKWVFDVLVMFFRWIGKKLLNGRNAPKRRANKNA